MKNLKNLSIALYIDAENLSHEYLNEVEKNLEKFGRVIIKRAYGDFFYEERLKPWIPLCKSNNITTVPVYAHVKGKNAADHKLITEATKELERKVANAYCIMSSDSDFMVLGEEIKGNGCYLIGAGDKATELFKKMCDHFIELKKKKTKEPKKEEQPSQIQPQTKSSTPKKFNAEEEIIYNFTAELLKKHKKPMDPGAIQKKIILQFPDFDFKKHGAKRISDFFEKSNLFLVERHKEGYVTVSLS